MSTLRIAHFSDTHVLSLDGVGPRQFLNKRWTGAINLALNRSRHYRVEIFERLLDAVSAAAPDHTVCTGDLVNLALEPEFERVGELLRAHFEPHALTLIPGNHDAYVEEAVDAGLFSRHFGPWMPHDVDVGSTADFPVVRLRPGLMVIGLNSAVPTPVFLATGRVDLPQLDALGRALADPAADDRFRLLLIHHPLLPDPERRMERTRCLLNAEEVIDRIWQARERRPHLVVHGHNHAFLRRALPGTGTPIIQVASASRAPSAPHRAAFNVYCVKDGQLVAIERHRHDPETDRFVPHDEAGVPLTAARLAG